MTESPGADLRDQIAADLSPVEPLAPGWRRALPAGVWGSISILMLLLLGSGVAPGNWCFSLGACVVGFIALAQCCEEAIPASGLTSRDAAFLAIGLVGFHAYVLTGGEVQDGQLGWSSAWTCWAVLLGIGAPTTAWSVYQAHRGLPGRWWVVGLLAATGSYLLAVGAWHLANPSLDFGNLLVGHSGALCSLLAFGWGLSFWLQHRRV